MSHLPPLPASLKPIQHYLKTAEERKKEELSSTHHNLVHWKTQEVCLKGCTEILKL
jgi:hypothetical protein